MAVFRFPKVKFYNWIRRIPNPLLSDIFWIIIMAIVFLLFIALFLRGLVAISEAVMGLASFQEAF